MLRKAAFGVGLVVLVLVAPGQAAKRSPCPTKKRGSIQAIAVGSRAVMYRRPDGSYSETIACDRKTGDRWSVSEYEGEIAAAGRYGVYVDMSEDIELIYRSLHIVDVVTGEHNLIDGTGTATPEELQQFIRVVARPSGAVAFTSSSQGLFACRVCRRDQGLPKITRLAGPEGLERHSLRVTPRGVAWRQNGRLRHARLP